MIALQYRMEACWAWKPNCAMIVYGLRHVLNLMHKIGNTKFNYPCIINDKSRFIKKSLHHYLHAAATSAHVRSSASCSPSSVRYQL